MAFTIESPTHPILKSPPTIVNVHLEDARGSLRFSPRGRAFVAASAVILVALFSLVLWVLVQLRAVFRTLRAGRPFVPDNATRIRRIAYAVLFGEGVRALALQAGMRYGMTHFSVQGVRFESRPDVNVVAIVCGLIILIIAEVFREGTGLEEEQSLTV